MVDSIPKIGNPHTKLQILIVLWLLLVLGFLPIVIPIYPPKFQDLQISNGVVTSFDTVRNTNKATFELSNGLKLSCEENRSAHSFTRWECPKELADAVKSRDPLTIWYEKNTIYQIKDGNRLILDYKEWMQTFKLLIIFLVAVPFAVFLLPNSKQANDFKSKNKLGNTVKDVDEIAVAEVYVAYGKKRQAIEILEKALLKNPARKDIAEKLAEFQR